jgi:hypothetical protein
LSALAYPNLRSKKLQPPYQFEQRVSEMTVLKTRSRMVSVRLFEDEYIALRELCSSTGSRSVSDLTRDAMRAFLKGTDREESLHMRMNEFCAQMSQLGRRIDELVEKFAPPEKQIEP